MAPSVLTISNNAQVLIIEEFPRSLIEPIGQDITGDGTPDVIIQFRDGGARCCTSYQVFELGNEISVALASIPSTFTSDFKDIDGDGFLEFITKDEAFLGQYCPWQFGPAPHVVMRYQKGRGYFPASTAFADYYAEAIERGISGAETATPGDFYEYDETTKCTVLRPVLDLLYSGQKDKAWQELERLYHYPDREQLREAIEKSIQQSPLYVEP